ncbi:MAG: DNA polymerase III subunit epsilon [Neisseriaceae bacterium]|nr:MAG: DNA polymerase III subunit epsilon [Neisseriaceae bacterium]
MRQIIIDTETTGLYVHAGDRIIEFAGLEMISRRLTGRQCHFYIYPECDINEEASKIHGLRLSDLEGKPKFAEVGQEIHDFLRDSELIIHNAPFDIGFLNMEFSKIGLAPVEEITNNVIDTLVEAKRKYPGKRNSLDALCERLEIDRSKRVLHGALVDCDLLAQVYLAMTHNQFTLDIDLNSDLDGGNQQNFHIDYNQNKFKVLMASGDENKLHEAYLDELSRTCLPIYRYEE